MKLTKAKLEELKKQTFPQATPEDFGLSARADGLPEEMAKAERNLAIVAEYLKPFVKRSDTETTCLCCGEHMSFRWAIAHGEGHCHCGYPCRAYHFIDFKDGQGEQRFARVLQYQPSELFFVNPQKQKL